MRAALFDMDRTLVRKETGTLYVKYQHAIGEATRRDLLRVLYWVTQYTLGVIDAKAVATKAVLQMKGTPEMAMATRCDDWFRRYVETHVCDLGRRAVELHRERGDLLAIVTGATPYAARPLARRLGIPHVVASELEVDDTGLFTGRFVDPLCYGDGKIVRAKRLAEEHGFALEEATFYSDSYTDLPLLEAVAEPVIVNPDPRLERVAKQRGWRIEAW
ncbi:MAG: Phosphoserine phosphatase [Labilithrix sp.]|jgi:HAD superfamily hydrolase (TIGR01490 family)|nr:Phosphoserine phosphatase [Labilithrix sp.]